MNPTEDLVPMLKKLRLSGVLTLPGKSPLFNFTVKESRPGLSHVSLTAMTPSGCEASTSRVYRAPSQVNSTRATALSKSSSRR